MSIKDTVVDIALDLLTLGIRAAVRQFEESQPNAADKVKAAAEFAQQAIDMLPEDKLRAHLSDEDAATAIAVARVAKAVKLQGA